ncbi:hypothetical protein DPMN_184356 [Dreissena polymorpha]|uniref:Uncharacterized protein n=1 Tax=Dreissena polymorpha TaxID=45954 RepID=A0A9D4DIM2_DREPO|nr:hypothetical protein DPMN_184356 [Dreissena polymorpha]
MPMSPMLTRNGAAETDAYPHGACLTQGRPRVGMGPCIVDRIVIREVQYQLEVNRCRNEEIIVKAILGGRGLCGRGTPGLVMGPYIVEIDRIVIRETDRHRAQTMTNDSALACLSLKSVRICTIFDLIQDIIGTNLRTKFHEIRQ